MGDARRPARRGRVLLISLSARLIAAGEPLLQEQLRHPTVVGIACGDLPEPIFRAWLEQDYLFLLEYVRVFARLAWQAPDEHLGDLIDLAHSTFHEEMELHRSMADEFGAALMGAVKGKQCANYTAFLLDAAADYASGLAALLPCMWGYSELGRRMARPNEPRYRRWVESYAAPEFAALAERCAQMLDEAGPHPDEAERLFLQGMRHELAFWDVDKM